MFEKQVIYLGRTKSTIRYFIMSINPGFGGQQFIKTTLPKIIKAREMLNALSNKPLLEVDGGVNLKNIAGIARGGG